MKFIKISVDTPVPNRLDRYLKRLYPNLTQGIIQKALRNNGIKFNNKKCEASIRVINGDEITVHAGLVENSSIVDNTEQNFSGRAIRLSKDLLTGYLVYEDENLLAINKPAGLATQGGSKISLSVNDAINYLNKHKNYDLRLVHRLDKDTSGLLLIAKNYPASIKLTQGFKDKIIQKTYYAMVHGYPTEKEGELSTSHAETVSASQEILKQVQNDNKGKLAVTHYKLLKTLDNRSLIEFKPLTGRMHQLRRHAKILGCPIVGDKKYGIDRQGGYMLLHAKVIIIPEEIFGKRIEIECELPEYFEAEDVIQAEARMTSF